MQHENVEEFLTEVHQEQLLEAQSHEGFEDQLALLSAKLLEKQRKTFEKKLEIIAIDPIPPAQLTRVDFSIMQPHQEMGCIVLAGGQGSRLGFSGPKGCFTLKIPEEKSLFQIVCEKILITPDQCRTPLPVAFMTSPHNHEETIAFFEENDYFGLEPDQVDFYTQDRLPLMNEAGNWFLSDDGGIAFGPDGNGKAIHSFYTSGIWDKWNQKGVKYINVIPVDNPLAKPCDGVIARTLETQECDLVVKAIKRIDPAEKVGVLGLKNGELSVMEYSEILDDVKEDLVKYPSAYSGMFACSMAWARYVACDVSEIPFHVAKKRGKLKFEYFIFDIFNAAKRFHIIEESRDVCFCPVKDKESVAVAEWALSTSRN